uniref:Uncharacterized protein n=1 Tax=Candidatus Nitrotoga fabula TaxID=2182327 RepID=A0A2X0QU93_9PROT|nr:protein of unknown function [Candidatus Nitrotoga fabula]
MAGIVGRNRQRDGQAGSVLRRLWFVRTGLQEKLFSNAINYLHAAIDTMAVYNLYLS